MDRHERNAFVSACRRGKLSPSDSDREIKRYRELGKFIQSVHPSTRQSVRLSNAFTEIMLIIKVGHNGTKLMNGIINLEKKSSLFDATETCQQGP